jgi:hypothetical protein
VESDLSTSNSKALLPPFPSPEYSHFLDYLSFSLNGWSSSGRTAPMSAPYRWYSSFSPPFCLYSRQLRPQRLLYCALWLLKLPSWLASSGARHSILPKTKIRLCNNWITFAGDLSNTLQVGEGKIYLLPPPYNIYGVRWSLHTWWSGTSMRLVDSSMISIRASTHKFTPVCRYYYLQFFVHTPTIRNNESFSLLSFLFPNGPFSFFSFLI